MPMIGLECKTCESRYKVAADSGATKINCRKCGSPIHIPAARRTTSCASAESAAPDGSAEYRRGTTGRMTISGVSTRRRGHALSTYLLAGLALVAVVSGVFYLLN